MECRFNPKVLYGRRKISETVDNDSCVAVFGLGSSGQHLRVAVPRGGILHIGRRLPPQGPRDSEGGNNEQSDVLLGKEALWLVRQVLRQFCSRSSQCRHVGRKRSEPAFWGIMSERVEPGTEHSGFHWTRSVFIHDGGLGESARKGSYLKSAAVSEELRALWRHQSLPVAFVRYRRSS